MHALRPGDVIEITQPLQDFPAAYRRAVVRAPRRRHRDHRDRRHGGSRSLQRAPTTSLRLLRSCRASTWRTSTNSTSCTATDSTCTWATKAPRSTSPIWSAPSIRDTELYMCGPIRLMDAVRRAWVERELLACPTCASRRSATAAGTARRSSSSESPQLDLEVTVVRSRSDHARSARAAGVDMIFDCRKGECGLCEVRVLDLEGVLDHRDVFYSERQQDARSKLCCCVSRAVVPAESGGRAFVSIEARDGSDGIVDVSPTPPACRRDTADAARSSAPSRSRCAAARRRRRRSSAPCSGRAGWRGTRRARPGRAGIQAPG